MSYANCAIIISNNSVTTPHTGGYSSINPKYKYTELLKYFEEKAEKIFILLDDEVNIFYDMLKDIDDPSIQYHGYGWASLIDNSKYFSRIDLASDNDINDYKKILNIDDMTKNDWNEISLRGELSAINDKINECLDVSLIDNCKEKKQFYNTMFKELCRERDKIKNKLKTIEER